MPPIRLFDMGSNKWTARTDWPEPTHALCLAGGGRASIRRMTAACSRHRPAKDKSASCMIRGVRRLRMAARTARRRVRSTEPASTGAATSRRSRRPASRRRRASPALFAAEIIASADQPSFDLNCTVSRVTTRGQVLQIAAGHSLVPAGAGAGERRVHIPLQASCAMLQPGERLRLSIAGAAFPAFPVNPGSGADPAATPSVEARITTIAIGCGPNGSRLLLPTPETGESLEWI